MLAPCCPASGASEPREPEGAKLKEKIGWVRKGKGQKDRMIILSDDLISDLKTILETHEGFLFPGRFEGKPVSKRYIQKVVKDCASAAKIKKDVHLASISGGTDIVSCFVLGNIYKLSLIHI